MNEHGKAMMARGLRPRCPSTCHCLCHVCGVPEPEFHPNGYCKGKERSES